MMMIIIMVNLNLFNFYDIKIFVVLCKYVEVIF